jgi:N-acetylglutamate synthase-like GNAT family acetyltransferase
MELKIRKAILSDAPSIVNLSGELGYQTTIEDIINNLKGISEDSKQEVFVAELENVIGWMHIALTEPLESRPFAEIKGIVVKEGFRNKGAGTKLIKKAEEWTKGKGFSRIRIRTNITREETREYYRHLGFVSKKMQEVFEKQV